MADWLDNRKAYIDANPVTQIPVDTTAFLDAVRVLHFENKDKTTKRDGHYCST